MVTHTMFLDHISQASSSCLNPKALFWIVQHSSQAQSDPFKWGK
jgi:hypothetical protein